MPLKLTLKPDEKLIVNGAVLSNNSPRAVTLTFHNKAQLLQQKDVLLPEDASTPLLRTYFAVQSMYIDPERVDEHRKLFVQFASELYAATSNVEIRAAIEMALKHVSEGQFYRALTALRSARPAEDRLLNLGQPAAAGEAAQ
jgi:flagellar biosynthesis repressor protein FlbT